MKTNRITIAPIVLLVIIILSSVSTFSTSSNNNFFIYSGTKLIKSNNGIDSKQIRLYEYITSSARFRKMQEKMDKKLKLDELQRKEEARAKKMWNERKSLIQDWFELDRDDQEMIDSMTEKEEFDEEEGDEDTSEDKKEDIT